jgi:hypothetical protein
VVLMAQNREHYGKNGKNRISSVAMKTRLGSHVCLAALLALTLLPLVHQWHLYSLEKGKVFHASGIEHEVGLSLNESDPDGLKHSRHNAATCPICRATSICRYFSAPTLYLSPILATRVQGFSGSGFASLVANSDILIPALRAPPTSI